MALSDYLTSDEWDACFYAAAGQHAAPNFGESMHKTIQALLESGYRFPGLDEDGNKRVQVENGVNAPKACIFLGNPYKCDIIHILDRGREFWKQHLPRLVDETDEEWAAQQTDAKQRQQAIAK